jgi:2-(1,2-epoxy-1,2-dihydrophenyl)acetyl-CoA isomerase
MMQRPPDQGTGWHAGRSARVSDATEASEVPGLGVARDEHVLRLRLQRPEKRNSLTHEMIAGLIEQLELAALDDEIRAIALTAQGEHFCTGADIVAINREGAPKPAVGSIQRRLPIQAHRLIPLLLNTQKLVVCGVRGFASGIGLHLALAADFTIAASDARFWEPFSTRGFTVDSGGSWLIPRLAGIARAKRLLLLGEEISGADAAGWGLVHDAVAADGLDAAMEELVQRLAGGPTVALGLMKWLVHRSQEEGLEQSLTNEGFALELSSRGKDFREGLAAFKEKRPPRFEGR